MTRGKHGAAATVRRVAATAEADIATYQRRVAALTAELREAKDTIARERRDAHRRERILQERLAARAAPEIAVLTATVREVRTKLQQTKSLLRERTDQRDKAVRQIIRDIIRSGGTWHDAIRLLGQDVLSAYGRVAGEHEMGAIRAGYDADSPEMATAMAADAAQERKQRRTAMAPGIRRRT